MKHLVRIIVTLLGFSSVLFGGEIVRRTESKGLVIEVSYDDEVASWDDFEVTCRVVNTTGASVPFVLRDEMRGFAVEVVGQQGNLVPPRPEYARFFVSEELTVGNRRRVEILPGKSAFYRFKPVKMFQTDDLSGCRVRVSWGPVLGPLGPEPKDGNLIVETTFPAQRKSTAPSASAGTEMPAVNSRQGFARLPVLERNAILTEIRRRDFSSILQAMLDAGRIEHDPSKQLAIQTTLTFAMQERKVPPEFFAQLREFLVNNSNSDYERNLVLGAVGAVATKEATDFLIEIARAGPSNGLKQSAGGSLSGAGAPEGARMKSAPALEQVWRESTDQNLILGVALPMAQIGAPSSIKLLLAAALAPDGEDNVRKRAALGVLDKIYQPAAVPTLASVLTGSTPGSPESKLIGRILVNIGDETASRTLVEWLKNADASAVPLARDWVLGTHHPALLVAWSNALDSGVRFRNEEIRTAIRIALTDYRQNRSSAR